MKINHLFQLAIISISTFSCGEDEDSCSTNGNTSEGCMEVTIRDYNVQTINSNPPYQRENLQLAFINPSTNGERFGFVVRSNENGSTPSIDGELILFEQGDTYEGSSLIFNGNINAPGSGILTTILTKVDRTNGMVSGTWSFDAGDQIYSGSFTDISVALTLP